MNLNTFLLFDGALMLIGLPILMIWKGKKIMTISYHRKQRIILLARLNLGLASKDQEEIDFLKSI
tara:strand:- start:451 stop:645 length:195 start_codon:yes stop_codon:yes gene_type:complete